MHVLIVILIILLALLVIAVGVIAFIMFSVFMTVQPILQFLGKMGLYIWLSDIAKYVSERFGRGANKRRRDR